MKRLSIISIFCFFTSFFAHAQGDELVMTWSMVVNEVKRADEQAADQKRSERWRTWTERGRKYIELYAFDMKEAYPGLLTTDLIHAMKSNSKSQRTSGDTLIHSFDRIDFYFVNNELIKYNRTDGAVEHFPTKTHPLDVAVASYTKARELNDGKQFELIGNQLNLLISLYTNEGYYYIKQSNYKKAEPYFSKIADIVIKGYDNNHDSTRATLLNDCGTVAYWAESYDNAITYYNAAISKGLENVALYGTIMNSQMKKNDTVAAIKTIHTVLEKYPNHEESVEYLKILVNIYLAQKNYDEALAYLQKAHEREPQNANFLLNIAILHETSGDVETAKTYYVKTLELEPTNLGANANLGLLYVTQARVILQEATAAFGTKNFKPKSDQGQAILKKSIPYYETYAEHETDIVLKRNAYTDLMSIYSQLRMDKDYDRIKQLRDSL
jgi:tetratricopeptide (TPR) repeat protein